jgi:hypothetical protein
MALWLHSAVLAVSIAATAAVGIASAAIIVDRPAPVTTKSDRLPLAKPDLHTYMTVEMRSDGVSVLKRVPIVRED